MDIEKLKKICGSETPHNLFIGYFIYEEQLLKYNLSIEKIRLNNIIVEYIEQDKCYQLFFK